MYNSPKRQLALRVSVPMAAAAQECAWALDRARGRSESSGFMQRYLHDLLEQDLRDKGFWPPNEKTWAGEAPRSPHTGRIPDAERERRTEGRIERRLERERVDNGGLTDREYFEKHGHFPGQLRPARTREEAFEPEMSERPQAPPPADEAHGDEEPGEAIADDEGNIL